MAALAQPAVLGHTLDLLLTRASGTAGWLGACAVLIGAEVLLDAVAARLTAVTTARTTAWLRRRTLGHLLAARLDATAPCPPGDIAVRLTANATAAGGTPAAVATLVASLLPPVGGLAALFVIDPWTGLVFVTGLPLLLLLLRAFTRATSEGVARYQRAQSAIATRLLEAVAGARTIAAAGTEDADRARILAPLPELAAHGREMWRVQGRAMARGGVLMPLLATAVVAVAGTRLAAGQLTVGALLAAARYASLAAGAGAVASALGAVVRGRAAADRLTELLALPATPYGTGVLPPGPGGLELRGVSVRRAGRPVLTGVDLRVPGGARVAVVGRSGAGKSTLAAVAGRLLDPDLGEVRLDGVPLPELARSALRREVAYAFERPVLLGRTVGESLGGPVPPVRAARAADADGFVRLLPRGYDTPPDEAPLSGGELQRLGLARAFASAARLLVLDDAMSSLDTVTEHRVTRALGSTTATRLIITHRLATAAASDLVVWLEAGRVRAVGPHAVLWETPEYRAVFGDRAPAPAAGGAA